MRRAMYRKERLDRGIKVRTDGIYFLCSPKEILYLVLPRLLPAAVLLILPALLPPYWKKVVVFTSLFALLSISWDFLRNFAGLISLGQAFFSGTGAYIAAFMSSRFGWSPLFTLPFSTVLGAVVCTILLLPALRIKEIYFAIVTLVLPLIFMRIIEATAILGGTEGISGVSPFPGVWTEVYLITGALLLTLFSLRRLVRSDTGLILMGIMDNDQAVRASGIDIFRYRALALFLGSIPCTFAGAFLSHEYMFAGLSSFALDFSIVPIAATVLGGGGTLSGPFLGAFILVPLSEMMRAFGSLRIAFYALILTASVVAMPEGIFNYLMRKYHQFERWVEV